MAERGGTTTQSGILYQNSVAALYLGRLCDATPRPDRDRVVGVRVEAPTAVDDTVVTFADGGVTYIQAKENIRDNGDAWAGLWGDFEAQFDLPDFKHGKDRLLLHTGEPHDEHHELKAMCERAAHSLDSDEMNGRCVLPQDRRRCSEKSSRTSALPCPATSACCSLSSATSTLRSRP
ncbi:MAG: hypothetical protein ACJ741_03535 [Pyrinomonadaceae bacterium]